MFFLSTQCNQCHLNNAPYLPNQTPRDFVDLPTPEECSEAIGDFFYRTLKAYEDEAREVGGLKGIISQLKKKRIFECIKVMFDQLKMYHYQLIPIRPLRVAPNKDSNQIKRKVGVKNKQCCFFIYWSDNVYLQYRWSYKAHKERQKEVKERWYEHFWGISGSLFQ